ncbi:MAG: DUF4350 domain-containing protein [Kineosporiaceae bacterium]|nr:DUF4350 domain-containing protein [Kineosporiaceae bacterium]
MTGPVTADPAADTAVDAAAHVTVTAPSGAARALRRWRVPGVIALAVLAVVVLGALLTPTARDDLDPESPAPDGARAVARILAANGVRVDVARRSADLAPGTGVTVFVSDPQLVPDDVLRELAASDADLVLLGPNAIALQLLDLPVFPDGRISARSVPPDCTDPEAGAAGTVRGGGWLYRPDEPAAGDEPAALPRLCYPERDGAGNGMLAVLDRDDRRLTVLGQADVLRNEFLALDGNAALALRVLGGNPVLQWYIPDPAELSPEAAPTLRELAPRWVLWMPAVAGLSVLMVILWRGRRLGRLVGEPLPVVVRAAETQEGRARLYRQAHARDRAAAILRTAALRRLARRFEASASTPELLAARVAEATGRPVPAVEATLLGTAPRDDAALVRLAREIDAIEQDVTGTPAHPPAPEDPWTSSDPSTSPATPTIPGDGR